MTMLEYEVEPSFIGKQSNLDDQISGDSTHAVARLSHMSKSRIY